MLSTTAVDCRKNGKWKMASDIIDRWKASA